jgi:CBS domain-containing protein
MAQLVKDLMTADPVTLPGDAPVRQAAIAMLEKDIGDVLVVDGGQVKGIVTDRDIVIRGVADRDDLSDCRLSDVCSSSVVTAEPNEDAARAIADLREHAIRRVPVVDNGTPVGVLSIGDAAIDRDARSALADISSAEGNS